MINVLIADDDHNARLGLTEMLDWSKLGANLVAAVEDGEKVVEILKEHSNIDLIILDVCMPHMDGLAVAKYVHENNRDTDIILLSAHAEFEYAREALRYGVREYIIKPINRTKLNQLSEAVAMVQRDKKHTINWRLFLHSPQRLTEVTEALRYKKEEMLDKLLDMEPQFDDISIADFKEYCLVLMGYIREYIKSHSRDTEICEKSIGLINEISDIPSMKKFFKETFKSIILLDSQDSGKTGSGVVAIAKEYINNNILSADLHSYSVASHLNLSVDHLSRLFKSVGEGSLSDYIIKAKIEKAKDIISNTSYSIRQVAQILGYSDPGYFVRVFKKKTSVTPTEYRMGAKEGHG